MILLNKWEFIILLTMSQKWQEWIGCEDSCLPTSQATSVSRAVGFNNPKLDQFFSVCKSLLEEHKFSAKQLWYMDETGTTNVHKLGKIIERKANNKFQKLRKSCYCDSCMCNECKLRLCSTIIYK